MQKSSNKLVDANIELSEELRRKMQLLKVINHHVFHCCKKVLVTQNHYYIISERNCLQTLQTKKLNHQINEKEIFKLLRTFRIIFQELKKTNSYHGHLNLQSILAENTHWKCQFMSGMEMNRFKFIIEIQEMKKLRLEDHGWMVYYPPEVFLYKKFSEKTDIWAFGMILYHQIYGLLPWDVKNLTLNEFIHSKVYNDIIFPSQQKISSKLTHLIYCCLKPDEDLRFCYQDFLDALIFERFTFKKLTNRKEQIKNESIFSQSSMKTLNSNENYKAKQKTEV